MEKRDTMRSETGLVVWMGTAPEDAASSVGHRMPSGAQNIAMVWPYGVAISPGRGGDFDVYGALLSNGARAWAVRVAWEDDD